ncbi:MAG: transcriptional regulator, partial [Asticcacaulis sp.]|nr:transcriptional regulator [Asticcacaulis sp.]
MSGSFAFEQFVLDTGERRLTADADPVDLNGRYFDALALLVREHGKLITKDRFLAEVWRGVPVTDEALTQCIKTLRRQLGDDAARPRFIETLPKHGYRFVAPVEAIGSEKRVSRGTQGWREFVVAGSAGTLGGAVAGLIGGLIYGFAGASQAEQTGTGAISTLLVLLAIAVLVAVIGAAGVSFAIATAELARTRSWQWLTITGAGGGLITGAAVKLLGIDSFTLLIGRAPHNITGAMEGLLVGGAVGASTWLAQRVPLKRQAAALGACSGGLAAIASVLLGGHLLLGSLATLTRDFPDSHLNVA